VDGVSFSPPPNVIVTGLTAGALDFSVRVWTTDLADWVMVRSELAMRIRDGLAEAGIEVPLPQRDLHLRSVSTDAASGLSRAMEADLSSGGGDRSLPAK
jgi:small-conductance mechanosensitive channel